MNTACTYNVFAHEVRGRCCAAVTHRERQTVVDRCVHAANSTAVEGERSVHSRSIDAAADVRHDHGVCIEILNQVDGAIRNRDATTIDIQLPTEEAAVVDLNLVTGAARGFDAEIEPVIPIDYSAIFH